ncbi:uncharacterized protein LOC110452985 isoform X2 [Mizuhopecten yessoensis]|uniref:uncharacterized protein LOC110452985 isoform X2 n=1 Tax=Mizuhopecten yessoensis TaxID=6573 RepID=UPI000B45F227|nr:uncharacterized protein LOC110452985 isoform X2 [Mizuhopecten yessoensis]
MALWYLVFVSTLVNLYKVLHMCEDGNTVGDHVVIDTYGSSAYRKDGGRFNCSCTVTLTGLPDGTKTTFQFESVRSLYPPSGCGSHIIMTSQRVDVSDVHPNINKYFCGAIFDTFNGVQTNDTFTVVWLSAPSGNSSGYCLSLTAGPGSSLSTKCVSISSPRETTTASQSRTTATQSKETATPSRETITQSREITTQSRMTTTQSRDATTYNSTNSGSTTLGQKCAQQNDLQQCYPLSAVVVPLVVTSLLVTVTVVVHVILYRKRLALVKQPEYTEAVMTSPNPVHYDSLDLSRVEPPNLYADTSTGQMFVNTAMES